MITIKSKKIVYVDIDGTLAIWNDEGYYCNVECEIKIKQFHARGHTLIAWSAGGSEWAETVIKKFQLEEYFTLCISKPDWYMDDLKSEEFLPEINRIPF